MHVALDNMSQGLCMFDRNERLVVCNSRYRDMYKLPADVARPAHNTDAPVRIPRCQRRFARDIKDYRRELHAALDRGDSTSNEVRTASSST